MLDTGSIAVLNTEMPSVLYQIVVVRGLVRVDMLQPR